MIAASQETSCLKARYEPEIVAIQMASLRFRIHLKPVLDSLDFEDPSK